MANTLIQIRVDEKLKDDAAAVFEQIGLDLSTAVRIFFKKSVAEQGIPFNLKLRSQKKIPFDVTYAMNTMAYYAAENGVADMTLEEINEEISKSRKGL